jgi:hypothetical protein
LPFKEDQCRAKEKLTDVYMQITINCLGVRGLPSGTLRPRILLDFINDITYSSFLETAFQKEIAN